MSIGQIAGDPTYSQKMPRAARPRVGRAALPCVSRLDAGWGGGPIYAKRWWGAGGVLFPCLWVLPLCMQLCWRAIKVSQANRTTV